MVVVRTLTERRELHTRTGHVALGWLVAEDLASVLLLVLLPIAGGGTHAHLARDLGVAVGGVVLMVVLAATVGRAVVPRLLTRIAHTRSAELFTLGVLVTALGIAVLSARLFGASLALGAFIAGLIVGQSELGSRAASDALPLRDAFAVIFFVAVGMTFDPSAFFAHPWPAIALTAIVLFGKPMVATGTLRLFGEPLHRALAIATPLGQIGELSFVIASAGLAAGMLDESAHHALIAASIFSILLNPLVTFAARTVSRHREAFEAPPRPVDRHRAVIVGCGPVGQVLIELLEENGVQPTVVDLNPETVVRLRARGVHAICGDATRPEILEAAGIAEAAMLVSAASGTPAADIARTARLIRPSIRIVARASFLEEGAAARVAGAHRIVSAEAEVALAMAEAVLGELGVDDDDMQHARQKVRRSLSARHTGQSQIGN